MPTLGIDHGVDPGVELAISCGQLAMVPLCVIFIEDGQGTEGLTELLLDSYPILEGQVRALHF